MEHKVLVPPGARGNITWIAPQGDYTIADEVIEIEFAGQKKVHPSPCGRLAPAARRSCSARCLLSAPWRLELHTGQCAGLAPTLHVAVEDLHTSEFASLKSQRQRCSDKSCSRSSAADSHVAAEVHYEADVAGAVAAAGGGEAARQHAAAHRAACAGRLVPLRPGRWVFNSKILDLSVPGPLPARCCLLAITTRHTPFCPALCACGLDISAERVIMKRRSAIAGIGTCSSCLILAGLPAQLVTWLARTFWCAPSCQEATGPRACSCPALRLVFAVLLGCAAQARAPFPAPSAAARPSSRRRCQSTPTATASSTSAAASAATRWQRCACWTPAAHLTIYAQMKTMPPLG